MQMKTLAKWCSDEKKIEKKFDIGFFFSAQVAWRRKTGTSRAVTSIQERQCLEFCSIAKFVMILSSISYVFILYMTVKIIYI